MINFNKNNLFFLAMITASCTAVSAAELEIQFTDGAEMNAPISGGARFNGSGTCELNGSVTDDVTLMAGNTKVSSAAPFGTDKVIFLDDGTGHSRSLEAMAPMDLPDLQMNSSGKVIADAAVNLKQVSGNHKLTLAGVGVFTPIVDSSSSTNDTDIVGAGGLSVASLSNKLPTGIVTVYESSSMRIAPGLAFGPTDVVAENKLVFKNNSTCILGNNASLDRYITVGSPS